jgi:hypothetical protein
MPAAAATAEAVTEVHRGLGSFIERRKGDQLLELWNKAGDEAGRQGMMLMGHGEDDAGTSEAVIDSGDGGRAGELLTKRGGRLEPERFLPWAAGRSSGWQRWARCQ